MKFGNGFRGERRRGFFGLPLTCLVIVAVLLLNLGISALFSHQLWWIDLTEKELHKLSPTAKTLLQQTLASANAQSDGDEPVTVEIIFCADPDMIKGNENLRYAYYSALQMQKAHPKSIKVSTTNVWKNPSSVDEYRVNAYSSIYQSNVIVSSGSEFRMLSGSSFLKKDTYNDGFDDYYGEKILIGAILAVTRAEAPICALTVNHGEPFATEEGKQEYSEFLRVIETAGYKIQYLNLEQDEIPADCRLIITFDPKTDFVSSYDNTGTVSEAKKLEKYLSQTNGFMVFTDADTPKLFNLEELLEQWGISYGRYEQEGEDGSKITGNVQVLDAEHAINGTGSVFYSQYATGGVGQSALANLVDIGGSPKILFGNATSIRFSDNYQKAYQLPDAEQGIETAFTYGTYYKNGNLRNIYEVFHAGDAARCQVKNADGSPMLDGEGNPVLADTFGGYYLMTLSNQSVQVNPNKGNSYADGSYVCAVASVEFASNAVLQSASYGNTDVLLSVLYEIGREVGPVDIDSKIINDFEMGISYYTPEGVNIATAILVVLPAVICAAVGIVILVKRRVRS